MPPAPHIHIVIPVYNEEDVIVSSLETLLTFLRTSGFPYQYQITVVDNASTDRTSAMVTTFANTHAEVSLLQLTEKGKGRAIRAGWAQGGDILAFMDADLSSDLSFFPALITSIAEDTADLAIGNRLGKNSVVISSKRERRIASFLYNAFARLLLRTDVDDHQCGFKAISRNAYEMLLPALLDNGFFFDTELIAWARRRGYRISQIDIRWVDSPVSRVALFSDSFLMFKSIVRLARRLSNNHVV